MDLTEGGACVAGVSTHDGHYMHYNIFGNFFEVSAKYVPPIRPIGRGAYGIVWCVFFFLLSPSSSPQLSFFKLFPFPFFFSTRLCPVFCRLQVSLTFYADFGRFDWGFFFVVVVDRNCQTARRGELELLTMELLLSHVCSEGTSFVLLSVFGKTIHVLRCLCCRLSSPSDGIFTLEGWSFSYTYYIRVYSFGSQNQSKVLNWVPFCLYWGYTSLPVDQVSLKPVTLAALELITQIQFLLLHKEFRTNCIFL